MQQPTQPYTQAHATQRLSTTTPQPLNNAMPVLTAQDANELAARRAHEAQALAKITGWKPLTIWYSFWAVLIGFGSITSLFQGQGGSSLLGLVVAVLVALYARYLYYGGRYRVWFVIW